VRHKIKVPHPSPKSQMHPGNRLIHCGCPAGQQQQQQQQSCPQCICSPSVRHTSAHSGSAAPEWAPHGQEAAASTLRYAPRWLQSQASDHACCDQQQQKRKQMPQQQGKRRSGYTDHSGVHTKAGEYSRVQHY
jgi:hypothetical protein